MAKKSLQPRERRIAEGALVDNEDDESLIRCEFIVLERTPSHGYKIQTSSIPAACETDVEAGLIRVQVQRGLGNYAVHVNVEESNAFVASLVTETDSKNSYDFQISLIEVATGKPPSELPGKVKLLFFGLAT